MDITDDLEPDAMTKQGTPFDGPLCEPEAQDVAKQHWPKALYETLPLSDKFFTIRLLKIRPGKENDPIRCRMFTSTAISAPPYEALSYTWGTSTELATIEVNGYSVKVTLNLRDAFCALREKDAGRVVWADAICINQHDVEERNAQVRNMGDVYSLAHDVVIWMEDNLCDSASCPELRGRNRRGLLAGAVELIREEQSPQALLKKKNIHSQSLHSQQTFRAIRSIYSRRWWKRVWVAQEVARARSDPTILFYGGITIRWSEVIRFAPVCRGLLSDTRRTGLWHGEDVKVDIEPALTLQRIRDLFRTPPRLRSSEAGVAEDLFYLLSAMNEFEATDPKDKIFGVWTLIRGINAHSLKLDYNQSVETVYLEAVKIIIEGMKSLKMLSQGRIGRQAAISGSLQSHRPSWLPDLSNSRDAKYFTTVARPRLSFFKSTELAAPFVRDAELHTPGFMLGRVTVHTELDSLRSRSSLENTVNNTDVPLRRFSHAGVLNLEKRTAMEGWTDATMHYLGSAGLIKFPQQKWTDEAVRKEAAFNAMLALRATLFETETGIKGLTLDGQTLSDVNLKDVEIGHIYDLHPAVLVTKALVPGKWTMHGRAFLHIPAEWEYRRQLRSSRFWDKLTPEMMCFV